MGKLAEFSIILHSNRQVFYPGEQLFGEVVVNLSQGMDMKSLSIECEGEASCHWSEEEGTGDNKHTVHYRGEEKFFEYVVMLYGQNTIKMQHPPGRYQYPFSFTLPQVLPSSFEATHGHIRYQLKAKINKPWKFDHKVKRPFTVNEVIDVNQPYHAQGPGGDVHKEVGCLCCAAGPLDLNASVDRGAYCPGETIFVNAQVQNHTTRDMDALKAKIVQTIEYHSTRKVKRVSNTLTRMDGPPIPKQEFATWNNQPLGIPAMPPTISNSSVIKVLYHVKVEVDVPWGMDPHVKLPVVIGTVPFRQTYGQPPQMFSPEQTGVLANFPSAPTAPPPPTLLGYPDMAPPSYASVYGASETYIGDGSDQHTYGNLNYMPVYTFAQPYQGQVPPLPQPSNGQTLPYPPPAGAPYPPTVNPSAAGAPYPPTVYPPPTEKKAGII